MEALVHLGLVNAVAAAVLAVAVWFGSLLCRRPALLHSLWLLVLLKLVTPPFFSVAISWPAASGAEPTHHDDAVLKADLSEFSPAQELPKPGQHPIDWMIPDPQSNFPTMQPTLDAGPPSPPGTSASKLSWQAGVGIIWLAGSCLWLAVAGVRLGRFQRLLTHATPAPDDVQERVKQLAGRFGLTRVPTVCFIAAPVSPLLWALVPVPRLLVPADLWRRLTDDQQQTLLAHELAHLRRRDHWVRLLELAALAIYWWHPVVWWARRALHDAEEQCCDAWVVWAIPDSSHAYATALVETLAFLSQPRAVVPLGASGIGHISILKRRLTMILRGTPPRALSRLGLVAVFGLGALLLPLVPTWAKPQTQDQPAQKRAETPVDKETAPQGATEQPADGRKAIRQPVPVKPERAPKDDTKDPADPKRPRVTEVDERLQKLRDARDEVEIWQAELEIKEAGLQAVEVEYRLAADLRQGLEKLYKEGAASQASMAAALRQAETLKVQIPVKRAELKLTLLRLRQAQRRWDLLERQSDRGPVPERAPARPKDPKANPSYPPVSERAPARPKDPNANPFPFPKAPARTKDPKANPPIDKTRLLDLERRLELLRRELEALREQLERPALPKNPNKKDTPR